MAAAGRRRRHRNPRYTDQSACRPGRLRERRCPRGMIPVSCRQPGWHHRIRCLTGLLRYRLAPPPHQFDRDCRGRFGCLREQRDRGLCRDDEIGDLPAAHPGSDAGLPAVGPISGVQVSHHDRIRDEHTSECLGLVERLIDELAAFCGYPVAPRTSAVGSAFIPPGRRWSFRAWPSTQRDMATRQ